jgi:hypothetical protein
MKIIRTSVVGGVLGSPKCVVSKHDEHDEAKGMYGSGDDFSPATTGNSEGLHGYGDAAPDDKYGYADAAPDSAVQFDNSSSIYRHGDATPDSMQILPRPRSHSPRGLASRRSSLKGSANSVGTLRRRASIGQTGGGGEIEVELPGQSQPVRRRRSITFNQGVVLRNVLPTKSLTDKPELLWFQDDEMDRIKREIANLVQEKARYAETHDACDSSVESGADEEVAGECTRGLERMLEPERTKVKKFQAWDTVMNEQYLQRQEGEFDDESLAKMYGLAARRSQREAQRRASKDEEEIKAYLRSTRRMCRRLSM